MPRATMAATALICVMLTAGCSGSDPITTSPPAGSPATAAGDTAAGTPGATAEPETKAAPLAGLSALQVWRKTKSDAKKAKSVHVSASFTEGKDRVKINLKLNDAGRSFGSVTTNGNKMTVRRVGEVLYYKADKKFWTQNADAQTAAKLANKWLKTENQSKDMAQFFQLLDMKAFISESLKLSAAERKSLKRTPGIPVDGRETVALKPKNSTEPAVLQVAADGPTLPLRFTLDRDKSQYFTFTGWNEPFTVVAPKGAIDMDKAI